MTRVALIACDHGLGHVRRSVLVAEALAALGAEVDLLAPTGAADRARRSLGGSRSPQVEDIDFATLTTPEGLRSGDPSTARWEERLPSLERYDRVVCDTLPEVLAIRPDATLLAQFLWHDVLDGIDPAIAERAAVLAPTAPLVIGSEPFAMPAVRALPGFTAVGMHAVAMGPRRSDARGLLISGGTTPAIVAALRAVVRALAEDGPGPYEQVLVDRELLPEHPPNWMTESRHTPEMYAGLAAALVRPGLGTMTELIGRGIPFWCVREAGNAELAHNAAVVERIGAGVDLGVLDGDGRGPRGALLSAVLAGPPTCARPDDVAAVRFDGARTTAELVVAR